MLTIYFGKSAAGKDTFMKKQVNLGIKPCVSVTTRPIRDGEKEGIDYFFVSKEKFFKMIENHELVEYRSYDTLVNGVPDTWYYGTPVIDIKDDYVTVVDVKGVKDLIKYYGAENVTPIYVNVDDNIRQNRAKIRGSYDETEWQRRLKDDAIKFSESEIQSIADILNRPITVINNNNPKPTFSKIEPRR